MSNNNDFLPLAGLGQIADDYDAILCDIWGVVHNGKFPHHEATQALERFRQTRGPVVMITNSPKPSVAIPRSLEQIGNQGEFYDAIVTSGDATIDEISRRAPGPAFKIGPERDDVLYENMELHFSDLDDAAFISCTGPFDDDETPEDYRELLQTARKLELPFICANPDVRVKVGDKLVYCGGALAQLYQKMDGNVIYAGKPHAPIYRLCRAWLDELLGAVPPKSRILCIGDNIFTDLVGAQRENYDCLFIQDGLYAETERQLKGLLHKHDITAKYIGPRLTW
ncbi:MAG: TIGR01459 family HAD-type hydrolase [Litorimonas sp.]